MVSQILLPGDIEFNPNGKLRYKIDGIPVPGCTTITGMMPKPYLVAWAAKITTEYINRNWMIGRAYEDSEINEILKNAKSAHRIKKEEAANKGTEAHAWFEKYVKAAILSSGIDPITSIPLPTDVDVMNAVNLFLKFILQHKIKWLKSEVVVGSRLYMFAGKFDAIAEIDGITYLIDFKTSSGIYYEQFVQAAGYVIACEEMGHKITERMILWVPKTGDKFKAEIVPTPLALDKKCFLAALDLYHCIQQSENIISNNNDYGKQ